MTVSSSRATPGPAGSRSVREVVAALNLLEGLAEWEAVTDSVTHQEAINEAREEAYDAIDAWRDRCVLAVRREAAAEMQASAMRCTNGWMGSGALEIYEAIRSLPLPGDQT